MKTDSTRDDRLFNRAVDILEGRANGFGRPVLWHLALRRQRPAMLWLASMATSEGIRRDLGRAINVASPLGMMQRAYRLGEPNAAQNLAMTYFMLDDLVRYRHWLRQGARSGDSECAVEARRFETRQPYGLARKIRRLRLLRKSER